MAKTLAVALVLVVYSGCATAPETPLPGGYPVQQLDSAQLFSQGRLIGVLRQLEIQQPGAPVRFYRVETVAGGWVGNVDGYGRFYKCEPFRSEPRDIGLFAMREGLGRLFETEQPIRIVTPGKQQGRPIEATDRPGKPGSGRRRD